MAVEHYRGVSFHKRNGKYRLKIKHSGRAYHFGYYDDPVRAAKIYDALIKELRGPQEEYNFDGEPPSDVLKADIHDMLRQKGLM